MSARRERSRSFILVPGAGGMAWYWHRVMPLLQQAGHEAIAIGLPADDPSKGFDDYADIVTPAIGPRSDAVQVSPSLGGFVSPLVCASKALRGLVFVNAMIPRPGETAAAWWGNAGAVTRESPWPGRAEIPRSSTSRPTSCTTYRRCCFAAAPRGSGSNPIPYSSSPAASSGGPRFRCAWSRGRMTASSRSNSRSASPGKG